MSARAVVFAYHDVGVRCLSVLLAAGVDVALVVTHRDDPREAIFFASVEKLARERGIPVVLADGASPELEPRVAACAPDLIFSFYYRDMLPAALLGHARLGAYNMHGSLLPAYRGRAPVNWAVLRGERETGATLHAMVEKPDAGPIVDQQAVPILPDDRAIDVMRKVTVAAELVLHRALAGLLAGTAPMRPQDPGAGSYFGARKPEDGRIDWRRPAREIHDLVRAVAPPYPGAFSELGGRRLRVLRTLVLPGESSGNPVPRLEREGDALVARCVDGAGLRLLDVEWNGVPLTAAGFEQRFGASLPLDAMAISGSPRPA